jgi:hypothetical protein
MFGRNRDCTSVGLIVTLALGLFLCQASVLPAQEKNAEIKALLKERSTLLDEMVKELRQIHESGQVDIDEVLKCEREALRAKLDLAESPQDRLAVLRLLQKNADTCLKVVENRYDVGKAPHYAVQQAKALVLEMRIEVLRQEQNTKSMEAKKGPR